MDGHSSATADQTGSGQNTTAPSQWVQNTTAQTGATVNLPTLHDNVFFSPVTIQIQTSQHEVLLREEVGERSAGSSSTVSAAPPAALNMDIMDISTSGAGKATSKQLCNSSKSGVPASHALAEEDAVRMSSYKNSIFNVGRKTGIDPAVIAAIISRSSRAGNFLQPDGWDSQHQAFGIMQVHKDNQPRGDKDNEEHMIQATELLRSFIWSMNTSWSTELRYKGGIAAYNCGPGAVTSQNVDQNTTGGDYSNDVIARAQWYKKERNY